MSYRPAAPPVSAPSAPHFAFDNSYARELPGFAVPWQPAQSPAPRLLFYNRALAEELRLDLDAGDAATQAAIFSGNRLPEGATPIAQVYAGHQFGHFSPQLGDGRALVLGEVIDRHGRRRDIAFKGSGRTPFSRNGDGKAALGPMLREVLIGEAMHGLGIPTTRALAVVASGDTVLRERALPGAILTRVALSHIRVGTFEFFAARDDIPRVRQLADYAIARHYPELAAADPAVRYLDFLRAVSERQAALLAQWMLVGFIHGVMNTDNMSIAGETIDYGPCAFLDAYDPATVFSSIDRDGRYAYARQPAIAQWNLARLAEALLPLLAADEEQAVARASAVVNDFSAVYRQCRLRGLRAKLGLDAAGGDGEADANDSALADDWLDLLHAQHADFTLAWRRLGDAAAGDPAPLRALLPDAAALEAWLTRWQARCRAEDDRSARSPQTAAGARAQAMQRVNPWLIARNQHVEAALAAASDDGDLAPFERLLRALAAPYDERTEFADLADAAPASFTASYRTFCGT